MKTRQVNPDCLTADTFRRHVLGHPRVTFRGCFRGKSLKGREQGKSTLIGALVGALVGTLVGALVGPLMVQMSLSPALCVALVRLEVSKPWKTKSISLPLHFQNCTGWMGGWTRVAAFHWKRRRSPHPHTSSLIKKIARFSKDRFCPY